MKSATHTPFPASETAPQTPTESGSEPDCCGCQEDDATVGLRVQTNADAIGDDTIGNDAIGLVGINGQAPRQTPYESKARSVTRPGIGTSAIDPSRTRATMVFVQGAIVSLSITLIAGLLGVLYYIPGVAQQMQHVGINLTSLRPIHTTFAAAFIFLGGIAVVHRYFEDVAGPMGKAEKLRTKLQVALWALAGVGILITLSVRIFSGREYMGFHPLLSIPIALGWMLFAWNAFGHFRKGFLSRPVFIAMWTVSLFFFLYTFAEQHAWLIRRVFSDPVLDMRLQWKATGTLVGSFNLLVYGSLYYIGIKRTGDDRTAHSNLGWALFGVGLLNSFTNFGHHTYHLPQSHVVKWISFVISMLEIIILTRVVWDITSSMKRQDRAQGKEQLDTTEMFMYAAKWWTAWILASALMISLPPLNAIIHGTTVVMGHAMGAEIGIDSMILFAAITWIMRDAASRRGIEMAQLDSRTIKRLVVGLNVSVAGLVVWLTLVGAITGINRYQGRANPRWIDTLSHPLMVLAGVCAAWFLGCLLLALGRLLFRKTPTRHGAHATT